MKSSAAFASAILATVLAGSPLLAAPQTEEKEKSADTCLLGPSASTPPGGHWYYRQDRANKRNCWYLGDAKGKAARKQVAEEDAAVPEKPVAPSPKKPAAQRQMTDARAEFRGLKHPSNPIPSPPPHRTRNGLQWRQLTRRARTRHAPTSRARSSPRAGPKPVPQVRPQPPRRPHPRPSPRPNRKPKPNPSHSHRVRPRPRRLPSQRRALPRRRHRLLPRQ